MPDNLLMQRDRRSRAVALRRAAIPSLNLAALPIHGCARALTRPQQSPASAGGMIEPQGRSFCIMPSGIL